MIKNKDIRDTIDVLNYFAIYTNGRQIPSEGLSLGMEHENTSVTEYRTLFEGSGIHHSNSGFQITHNWYIRGFFMLVFDLKTDRAASGHSSNPENEHILLELKFSKHLPDAITCLLYLEFENSFRIDLLRNVSTDF